jgi:hypothetical protein
LSRLRAVLVGLCLAASATQSFFFAWALAPDSEEEMYMYLGKLALTGHISLFQDDLTGNRMPLPYYVLGLSQLVWPRSLLAARFVSASLGLICLVLVWRIASRLAGEVAGILALLFGVTHGLLIGYFDIALYHSLVSVLILGALYLDLCTEWRARRLAAMALISLFFFTRILIAPLIPGALVYFLWHARDLRERLVLIAITVLPPTVFFATDPNHWKLLAYVPVLDRLAASRGFVSNRGAAFATVNVLVAEGPVTAVRLFARWYRMWLLAGVGVVVAAFVAGRPVSRLFGNRGVNVVAAAAIYLAACQVLIMGRWKLPLAVGYFPSFAILGAICLGCWLAGVLEGLERTPRLRTLALAGLCVFFLAAPALSRPLMLPLSVSWQDPPVTAFYGMASELGRAVPPGSKVFNLGGAGLYTAGLDPYVRQERGFDGLVTESEDPRLAKSGLWGTRDIKEWLGRDAAYAVIAPSRVAFYRGTRLDPALDLIDSLLTSHFTLISVIDRYPGSIYYVYRRIR